ncbi:MAG: hypothetical protein KJO31_18040 [Gammaproteobacteria bacterium]|nr:hypothetical protein [Gammaproteobacteria bacterium]
MALCIFGVALVSNLTWMPPEWQVHFESTIGERLQLLLVIALFGAAAIRAAQRQARLFWLVLIAGFFFWFVMPFPGLLLPDSQSLLNAISADVFLLAATATLLVAVEARLDTLSEPLWLQRRAFYIAGGLLFVIALYLYFDIIPVAVGSNVYVSSMSIYAASNLYIAIRSVVAGNDARSESWRLLYFLFSATMSLIFVADMLSWAFEEGVLNHEPGNWINVFWYLWYPVAMIASGVAATVEISPISRQLVRPTSFLAGAPLIIGLVLPFMHTLGYGLDVFSQDVRQARETFVAAWIVIVSVLFYALYQLLKRRIRSLETKRRIAEEKSEQVERQLQRELQIRSLGRLSAGLAHDFGNTVAAIAMHSKTIQTSLQQNRPTDRGVAGLAASVDYAQKLVSKLSEFGNSGYGFSTSEFDISTEIEKPLNLIRQTLNGSIELQYQRPTSMVVWADRSGTHQVITNYVYNAIDAVGSQGVVTVSLERSHDKATCASCGEDVAGDFIALTVTDTGPGIDSSVINSVFEPLVTTKPIGKGSGLGLSTVHGIMHRFGGHVGLSSVEGDNTKFIAFFPAA